jgi:hypothetical protein
MSEDAEISFKASYATGQSVIIPVAMIAPLILIVLPLLLIFTILSAFGKPQDPMLYLFLGFTIFLPYLAFFYGKPWKKFGSFHRPRKLIVANQTHFEETKRVKPIIEPRVRRNFKREKETLRPAENTVHLAEMLRFKKDGLDFGAYLQENSLKELVVVWVFECEGISYSLSEEQYNAIGKKIENGLSDFSRSASPETITLDAEVRSGCVEQLAATQSMRNARALPPEHLFILDGIDDRTKDLTVDGRIAPRHLRIYATTNLSLLGYSFEDMELLDRLNAFLEQQFSALKPTDNVDKELRDRLELAYEQGFKKWRRFIETKLELTIQTLSVKDAWQIAWDEMNSGPAPVPNRLTTLSDDGLTRHRSGDPRLLASLLFPCGEPTLGKDFVYLPGRKEYLGMCVMTKFPNRTWSRRQRKEQFLYGSAAINNPNVLNTRILVQLSTVDPSQAQFAANWKVKTENSAKDWNNKRRIKDVPSEVMFEEAEEVARSQKKGATSIKWAWVAMVSRPSISQLNDAIASLIEHSSFSGNIILREKCYCDELWLSAMPALSAHKILQKTVKPATQFSSFERRLENDAAAAAGVLPIMKEQKLHHKGYQLISRLKEPIYLDPCGKRPHLNFIINGEKGSGKSKMVQGLGENLLMQGGRLLIIDGARSDGSGSFDEWARFEPNAAYFNPNRDAYNIFDAVDQRYLTPFNPEDPESLDVWGTIEGFLIQSLTELSYQGTNPEIASKYKDLHSYFVGEFYQNDEIQRLRNEAFDGGIKSAPWAGIPDEITESKLKEQQFSFSRDRRLLPVSMPTLHHYHDFLFLENLPVHVRKYVDPEILLKTKGAIYSLLRQRLGRAIARPTNVNFDEANLIVYAMSAIREEDMLPLGIAMTGSILAQTNKIGLKGLILEEAALNLRHKVLSLIAAEGWAQGRKRNQHNIVVSQDIAPIVNSPAGNDIIKNSEVVIVGAIVPAAVDLISETCKIPKDALIECTQASFFPKDEEFGRNFLISTKQGHLFATDYPDFRSLFMVMNEASELDLKAQMKAQYPDNKFVRIDAGAKILRSQSIHGKRDGNTTRV